MLGLCEAPAVLRSCVHTELLLLSTTEYAGKVEPVCLTTIRQARQSDRRSIQRVFAHAIRVLAKDYYTRKQIRVWSTRLTPECIGKAIISGRVYVAEMEDRIVGYIQIDFSSGEVESVYVDPKHARQGIATAMMRFIEGLALYHGLNSLYLRASLNAVSFYRTVGFDEVEPIAYRLGDGTQFSVVIMRKDLARVPTTPYASTS